MKYLVVIAAAIGAAAAAASPVHADGSVCGAGASSTQTFVPKDKKLNSIHRCVESDPSGSEPANWFIIGGSSVHYSRVTTGNDYSDDWIAYITAVNSACLHRNGERYGECYDFYVSAYGDQEHEKKA